MQTFLTNWNWMWMLPRRSVTLVTLGNRACVAANDIAENDKSN